MGRIARRLRQRRVAHKSRPRLCVYRSLKHTYAQVIDDAHSHTVASACSLEPELRGEADGKIKGAELVGSLVGKRAMEKGVTAVVFDRRGYKYHGRVRAVAEAARKTGLEF